MTVLCRYHVPGLVEWLEDHAGHPLGPGYPTGSGLRGDDGTTWLAGWASVVRGDPCAYCGGWGGSLDHVVPQSAVKTGFRSRADATTGVHSWANYVGACEWCNGRKASRDLLAFLLLPPREPKIAQIRIPCRVSPVGARKAA